MSDFWPAEGSYLGHYRLVQKLDEGGMGAVYKAHEAALDRFVAVKVLSPEMAKDAEFVHSFLREARAVAAMNHPNIIQIYFIGQHDEFIYFAMELIVGHALDRLAQQAQKPTPKEWLGYARQAAVGLQYAHNHGVIHRDIKPSNLILNELGLVKVADFGLARKTGAGAESSLAVADSMGTPEYMSPEEAAGEDVDHRSDIYALGATLFHLLAGRPPFTGASGTEIMMHQMHTPLPSLRKINPNVPQAVCAIIEKCMAKLVNERFQSYDQLLRAIDDVLQGRSATRVPVPPVAHGATAKKPGPLAWLLIAAILVAAVFGFWKINEAQKKNVAHPHPAAQTNAPPAKPPPEIARPVAPPHVEPQPVPAKPEPEVAQPGNQHWFMLDLSQAFNLNVLSKNPKAQMDGFESPGVGSWYTDEAVKQSGFPNARGLPNDGAVAIPGAKPPGSFRMYLAHGNDTLWLTGAGGRQPQPVDVRLIEPQQHHCERLAFLHACAHGNGTLAVTLHYAGAPDEMVRIDLRDYAPMAATPATNSPVALSANARGVQHLTDFHAQIVPVNPHFVLKGFTLALEDYAPNGGLSGGASARFSAGVFAVSALRSAPGAQQNEVSAPVASVATQTPARIESSGLTNATPVVVQPGMPPANFRDVGEPVARLLAAMQFEAADAEAQRFATTSGDSSKMIWIAIGKDARRLTAFKRKTADEITARPGRTVSLAMRNGSRLDSQLASADMNEISLHKPLPGGFAETKVRWLDITPASLLPIFAATVDIKNAGGMYDYGLILFYQALYQQVRPEDAKRALSTAAVSDATFKADAEQHLKWLDEWLAPAAQPETSASAAAPESSTPPRTERATTVAAGPSRWNWRCLDITAACNADVIYTDSRAADEFSRGSGQSWTTARWLTRNNIAGDFNGIPDDGRVLLADNDPRLCFSITMPPRRSVILLTGENGRQPGPVRLDLPADLRARYGQISFLHASTWGDAFITVGLVYADGSVQTKHLQTLDWYRPGRSHDLTPDQSVAIVTRCNNVSDPSRFEMIAEIISADEDRRLSAITFDAARTTRNDARTAAGIFAVSLSPAAAK